MNAVAIPQAVGDWSLRGVDADQVFASQQLSDTAMTAACRVTARFDPSFPGWQLYRRVVAGTNLFDRDPPYVNNRTPYSASGFDPEQASAAGRVIALQLVKAW